MLERGNRAEQQAGRERDDDGEEQHTPIDADFVETRKVGWRHALQEPERRIRKPEAQQATEPAEHHAFDQQLAGECPAVGAEGRPDRELLLTTFRAD